MTGLLICWFQCLKRDGTPFTHLLLHIMAAPMHTPDALRFLVMGRVCYRSSCQSHSNWIFHLASQYLDGAIFWSLLSPSPTLIFIVAAGCLFVWLHTKFESMLSNPLPDFWLSPYSRPRDKIHLEVKMDINEGHVPLEPTHYHPGFCNWMCL